MDDTSLNIKARDIMPEGAHTLPARYYTDPGLFRVEMDDLFGRMWFYAARSEEIETTGQFVVRE